VSFNSALDSLSSRGVPDDKKKAHREKSGGLSSCGYLHSDRPAFQPCRRNSLDLSRDAKTFRRHRILRQHLTLPGESPDVREYITEIKPNLYLIPNAIAPDLENRLEASHNRDTPLRLRLRQIKNQYDYVFIDTPATRTAPMNANVAADEVIIVVE
jgi:cellulose biosynthesis protein BcsQ